MDDSIDPAGRGAGDGDSPGPETGRAPAFPAGRFRAGRHYITPGAIAAFEALPAGIVAAAGLVARHMACDWGDDMDEEDRASNNRAVRDGGRILSAYGLPDGTKVWIITEADRSATTLLLPHEH